MASTPHYSYIIQVKSYIIHTLSILLNHAKFGTHCLRTILKIGNPIVLRIRNQIELLQQELLFRFFISRFSSHV